MQTYQVVNFMSTPAFPKLEDLITASCHLHQAMLQEGTTTPAAVTAILDRLAPSFTADERRAVMRLAASTAGYVSDSLDDAMLTAMDSARRPTVRCRAFWEPGKVRFWIAW